MPNRANHRFFAAVATAVSACAVIAMCVFIFVMSSFDADDSTELSMGVVWHIIGFIVPGYDQMTFAEQLQWQQALDHPVRKVAHFLEYTLLGVLMANLVYRVGRFRDDVRAGEADRSTASIASGLHIMTGTAWALATAYAITDEIHQIFVPGRTCLVTDVLLDSAGVFVGTVLFVLVISAFQKRRIARGAAS